MPASSNVPGSVGDSPSMTTSESLVRTWTPAHRFAFRLAFPFLLFLTLPFPFGGSPGSLKPFPAYDKMWHAPALWVVNHIFHIAPPPAGFPISPLSDTSTGYADLLCFLVVAALTATVWTLLDKQPTEYRALHEYLRIYVRYMLAFTMLSYGMDKVLALQFNWSLPGPERLAQPFGNYSPFALMWTFMAYSTAYTRFAGIGEVIGGLLLFFRRTTTLGAFILSGMMANVVMLNFSYGVPVKLFSSSLLLLAMFLVVPDMKRLLNLFVWNRPVPSARSGIPLRQPWARIARIAQVMIVVFALYWFAGPAMRSNRQRGNQPRSPVYGLYQVDAFTQNGKPAAQSDANWHRLILEGKEDVDVIALDDSMHYFPAEYDEAKNTLTLSGEYDLDTRSFDKNRKDVLSYFRHDPDHLELRGSINAQPVVIELRKVDISKFNLVSRKFHWIENGGFYR